MSFLRQFSDFEMHFQLRKYVVFFGNFTHGTPCRKENRKERMKKARKNERRKEKNKYKKTKMSIKNGNQFKKENTSIRKNMRV